MAVDPHETRECPCCGHHTLLVPLHVPGDPWSQWQREKIFRWRGWLSKKAIARLFGVSPAAIQNVLDRSRQ